jgi:tRNA dimethylallyltransferase
MKVIIVSGPTASGKTDMAIDLAVKFGGEIINFDSLLLYREINIGTAKPTFIERKTIPHYMIDVASIAAPLNASDYAKQALPIVERVLEKQHIAYLVGGSGFYLQALLKGMYDSPTTPDAITKKSEELYQKEGVTPFLEILKLHDLESFNRYHSNDHYRVRRAVEHWWANGTTLSWAREQKDSSNQNLQQPSVHNWQILHLYLDVPKAEHLKIIEERTDRMLENGLYEEVKSLLDQGFSGTEKPLQSIGYKEILDFHHGKLKNMDECRERIIISTRQLAKSQRTWFKRDPFKQTYNPLTQKQDILSSVQKFIAGLPH